MLVCSAGMSTSLLVTKMQKAAEAKGMDADIFAVSASRSRPTFRIKTGGCSIVRPTSTFYEITV